MTEELRFTADAALIDRLGRELVGRQETALTELVKNSYDADAHEVKVTFDRSMLIIDDNGTGMSRDDLINGFLRLASDLKIRSPQSRMYNRQRAGRKGIGRFATQRLGSHLQLQTWTDAQREGLELTVDWMQFERGRALGDIPVQLKSIPPRYAGTVLRIGGLRDNWSENQIRRCWRGVINLQQPFPVAPVDRRPNADPGFKVTFWRIDGIFSDPEVIADFQTEILEHLHAVIEFRVDDAGQAEWRISRNKFGPDRPWSPIHHDHRDAKTPPNYNYLKQVWMKAYYFILLPSELPSLVYTRLRDVLSEEGGIRLYRNGFRVVPYGDPGNDWLRLDEAYSRRAILTPIANRNFFGVIDVQDPEGITFEEHTSREGLIETAAFTELKQLASSVLTTATIKIAEDRGRKTRAGGSAQRATDWITKLNDAARRAREAAQVTERAGATPVDAEDAPTPKQTAELLREAGKLLENAKAELADEAALLRLLATLGLTAAEFSHETGMTFEAVRLDFQAIFELALAAGEDDVEFLEQVSRARAMVERLDALTGYLNELASARAAREMAAVSVSKALEEFESGMKRIAAKGEIELSVLTPEYDALFTKPMHRAEVASILLNFYSNSVKAMRRTAESRKILVEGSRNTNDSIVISFSDTGDGIPSENWESVFDLFFTTRIAAPTDASTEEQVTGTGLGLWIVRQIVMKADGSVRVVNPPPGYATCIEVRLPAEEEDE